MKTTIELTPDTLAAMLNLVHIAAQSRGCEVFGMQQLVMPLLAEAQQAFTAQGNGADVMEAEKAKYAETAMNVATDLEGNT